MPRRTRRRTKKMKRQKGGGDDFRTKVKNEISKTFDEKRNIISNENIEELLGYT